MKVQKPRHSSDTVIYVQSGNTCVEISAYSEETKNIKQNFAEFFNIIITHIRYIKSYNDFVGESLNEGLSKEDIEALRFDQFSLLEAKSDDDRSLAKIQSQKFTDALNKFSESYDQMWSIARELQSITSRMESSGDYEGAKVLNNAYGSLRGNFLYSLKEAKRFIPRESDVQAVADLQKLKEVKIRKLPKVLEGIINLNDLQALANFAAVNKGKYANYRRYAGIGVGNSPNISGWSDYKGQVKTAFWNLLSGLKTLHGPKFGSIKEFDRKLQKKIASINKSTFKLGFMIEDAQYDEYDNNITLKF